MKDCTFSPSLSESSKALISTRRSRVLLTALNYCSLRVQSKALYSMFTSPQATSPSKELCGGGVSKAAVRMEESRREKSVDRIDDVLSSMRRDRSQMLCSPERAAGSRAAGGLAPGSFGVIGASLEFADISEGVNVFEDVIAARFKLVGPWSFWSFLTA
jgi:hypothetical protein